MLSSNFWRLKKYLSPTGHFSTTSIPPVISSFSCVHWNAAQEEPKRKRKGRGKQEKGLISLQNHRNPCTSTWASRMLQTYPAGLRAVRLETICCPLKKLFWVCLCIHGMEAKSGIGLTQFWFAKYTPKKKGKKNERNTPWLPHRNAQAFRFVLSAQTLDVLEYFWELE